MIAFRNLPRRAFPIHARAYQLDGSNEVVWDAKIESETAFTIFESIHERALNFLMARLFSRNGALGPGSRKNGKFYIPPLCFHRPPRICLFCTGRCVVSIPIWSKL